MLDYMSFKSNILDSSVDFICTELRANTGNTVTYNEMVKAFNNIEIVVWLYVDHYPQVGKRFKNVKTAVFALIQGDLWDRHLLTLYLHDYRLNIARYIIEGREFSH